MADITIPIESKLTSAPLDLGVFISNIVGVVLIIAAIATFLYLVLSGIQWITAGGDKNKLEEAKNRITGAIVGLVIVAASWAIFLLIDRFLGLGVANQSSSSFNNSASGSNTNTNTNNLVGFNCVNPPIICGDGAKGSYNYCQNNNYHAESGGSCKNGSVDGEYCRCVPN